MYAKYLIFVLLAWIVITNFAETQSLRGPRDYSEELPASRTGISKRKLIEKNSLNQTSIKSRQQEEENLWEPLACTQCLSDRYLVHYQARGCKPVNSEYFCKKPCPKYFECPKKDLDLVVEGCEYKGKVYKFGESVQVDNPCKKACYCDKSLDRRNMSYPEIRCALVDCFNNFRAPTSNCFALWDENSCCPMEKCLTEDQVKQQSKCLYDGKQYHLGQRIYPKEDPCLECVCNENWNQTNPVKSSGCKSIKCDVQSNANFKAGCLPIYHEKTCCPIEYFCPPPEELQCKFNGKSYLIGERLEINRERTECTCLIPPDFTCIQKIQEEKQLMAIHNQTEDYVKKFQTLPKIVITNSSEIPFANIPELNQESKCPPFIPGGLSCAGVNCTTIIDSDGCQACKCQKSCPLLKCKKGCNLFATTPGVCPQCECH